MNPLLLGTNARLWYLLQPALLSAPARRAIQTATSLAVLPIAVVSSDAQLDAFGAARVW